MPKLAANLTTMFQELPFLDRFRAAANNGFEFVEFQFPYAHDAQELGDRMDDARVTPVMFNMPPGNWLAGDRGIAVFPERSAEFTQNLSIALEYATILNVSRLHLMAGLSTKNEATACRRYEEALREAAHRAGDRGIDVLIEPLNSYDVPGYFLDDFSYAGELIDRLALGNLKLQFDVYHRQIMHGDVLRSLEKMMSITGHIQIAAVPARHEPGTGELDDFRLLSAIDELGYQGFVGCEYIPAHNTVMGLCWRDRVQSGPR